MLVRCFLRTCPGESVDCEWREQARKDPTLRSLLLHTPEKKRNDGTTRFTVLCKNELAVSATLDSDERVNGQYEQSPLERRSPRAALTTPVS